MDGSFRARSGMLLGGVAGGAATFMPCLYNFSGPSSWPLCDTGLDEPSVACSSRASLRYSLKQSACWGGIC